MDQNLIRFFDLRPGMTIAARYTVVAVHRQGGLSTAYHVRTLDGGLERELQIFPSELFEGASQLEDFSERMGVWRRLDHEAVLGVHECFELGTHQAVVTDLPAGRSLRAVLNDEERLEPERVTALGVQLLSGLAAIHAAGLVHGDIKPYTIHLGGAAGDERAVLIDGGVTTALWTAKDLGDKTMLIGTPFYAPLEQFGGDPPTVDSDLYNLASVLFECLAGVLPWRGRSYLEVFQAKMDKAPPAVARVAPGVGVPAELEAVIARGCTAVRKERYGDAAQFLEALADVASVR
ncbi:MAG: serine/threonine-protein kinase [Planctomycetota bacterium]